jgi:hypothetical protein
VEAAWRYLRDHGWIDTFAIPNTARINGRGIEILRVLGRSPASAPIGAVGVRASTSLRPILAGMAGRQPIDRDGIVPLGLEGKRVLQQLWSEMLEVGQLFDAPSYRDAHRDQIATLALLDRDRCLHREGDWYRMTPLGLLSLDEPAADAVVRIGSQVRRVLADRYRDPETRSQSIPVADVAKHIGIPREVLAFALFQLADAVGRWCTTYTTDLSSATAYFQPAERVLDGLSVSDVAREMHQWASISRQNEALLGGYGIDDECSDI